MKEIQLTQGKVALVDNKDYKQLNKYKWFARWDGFNWYAARNVRDLKGKRRTLSMHVAILGKSPKHEIDHRDRNGLNNQRINLRQMSHVENMHNKGIQSNNTSGFRGVSFHKATRKYRAYGRLDGKHVHLGTYNALSEANEAYQKFAAEHYPIARQI